MKKTTKNIILLLTLLFTSCNINMKGIEIVEEGTGKIVTKEETVNEEICSIRVCNNLNVIYTQAKGNTHITFEAYENLIDMAEANIHDGVLTLKVKEDYERVPEKFTIYVSSPNIEKLSIMGTASIASESPINTKHLDAVVEGTGSINIKKISAANINTIVKGTGDIDLNDSQSKTFIASIKGTGSITANGTTQDACYDINGTGDICCSNLKAINAKATVNGVGSIECNASKKIKKSINGTGSVECHGKASVEE